MTVTTEQLKARKKAEEVQAEDDFYAETKARADKRAEAEETLDDLDDLLDEIDEVLESNAAEFVRNYVQKGGE